MNYLKQAVLLASFTLLVGCTTKQDISFNKQIRTIHLDKEIIVAGVPQTVQSPVSINLGVGGYIGKHVGVHVGQTVIPTFENSDALNLEKGLRKYNISLANLLRTEFSKKMKKDSYYKNRFVPFGANHSIKLFITKYELDDEFLSSKAYPKIEVELKIFDKNGNIIYGDSATNSVSSSQVNYTQAQIYSSRNLLLEHLNLAISNVVNKLINQMKMN